MPALEAAGPDPERVVQTLADTLHVPASEAPAITKKAAVDLAAAAQAELDQRRADKAVAYWALASVLGLLLSATLGLYLLHIVGLRGDGLAPNGIWAAGILSAAGIRHVLDLLVTGLAIGGGTKPLHDLISNLQAAKVSKKDPSQTQQCPDHHQNTRPRERTGNPQGARSAGLPAGHLHGQRQMSAPGSGQKSAGSRVCRPACRA